MDEKSQTSEGKAEMAEKNTADDQDEQMMKNSLNNEETTIAKNSNNTGESTTEFKEAGTADSEFKAPSFIIPSKKKVQATNKLAPSNLTKTSTSEEIKQDNKSDTKNRTESANKNELNKESKETEAKNISVPKTSSGRILSPAEQLTVAQNPIPYKAPEWSGMCEEDNFFFEVIKNGAIVGKIELKPKPFHVIGRLPSCDVPMEHPSLSRYHAVVQYSIGTPAFPRGWYLYDLDSTHGTWINKNKVPPKKYHRLHVDFVLKFGGSTRLFILQGPTEDRLEESELSVTEMKVQREKQKKEVELLQLAEMAESERMADLLAKQEQDRGCSWGIDEDAEEEEEEEGAENPFAVSENEELYLNDPKKSLNGFFEREGYDPPEYEFTETGIGKWKCSVELPVDTLTGEPQRAEVVVSGKKKEAVVACALEACKLLDRLGVLRKSAQESRSKKQKNWEEDDFYDSDDDVYFDRTGTIEKKREYRKSKFGKNEKVVETYDTLLEKHKKLLEEVAEIENKLEVAKQQAAAMESDDVDALDAYMSAIKSGMMDTKTKMKLKSQLMELKREEQKLRKLVNIAKPASLPELKVPQPSAIKPSLSSGVGKIKGPPSGFKGPSRPSVSAKQRKTQTVSESTQFEVEEEEEEESCAQTEGKEVISEDSKIKDISMNASKGKQSVVKTERKYVEFEEVPRRKEKGPSLSSVLEKLQNESEEMDADEPNETKVLKTKTAVTTESVKRKNIGMGDTLSALKKQKAAEPVSFEEAADPDYAVWLPPSNQMGDGKTHLNEKYGY